MDTLSDRMLFTLKCYCIYGALLLGNRRGGEVAHERLVSPAFDPLSGFATRRLQVNQRYLPLPSEQTVVLAAALFGLAAYCTDGAAMRSCGYHNYLDTCTSRSGLATISALP